MNSCPFISVIVPVYNVEQYLQRCIESLLSQSFKNYEILLIDDGSTDKSGEICDDYEKKDNRCKVFHQENKGVSAARNKGLDECGGEWCCFVDADDWVEHSYLENFIIDNINSFGCIVQGFYIESQRKAPSLPVMFEESTLNNPASLVSFLEKMPRVHNGFIWHRLFSVNIIKSNKLRFVDKLTYAEDGVFFLSYVNNIDKSCFVSRVGYHYFVRNNSLTSSGNNQPKDYFYLLVDLVSEEIFQLQNRCDTAKSERNVLALYLWRLLYSWIIKKYTSRSEYIDSSEYVKSIVYRYPAIKDVDFPSTLFGLIVNTVLDSPSMMRYYTLKLLIRLYGIKVIIVSKFNRLRFYISRECKKIIF